MNSVNPIGAVLMVLGAAASFLAGRIAARAPETRRENVKAALKIAGLFVCMAGFLIALLAK